MPMLTAPAVEKGVERSMLARVYAHRSAITLHNFIDQCLKSMQLKNLPKK